MIHHFETQYDLLSLLLILYSFSTPAILLCSYFICFVNVISSKKPFPKEVNNIYPPESAVHCLYLY